MTSSGLYLSKYRHLTAQRAYSRAIAARGISALLAPYSLRVPVVPSQRRRAAHDVRAALSGGRTALDTAKAEAWDEALEAVANERGSFGMQTRNPYRADTVADQ